MNNIILIIGHPGTLSLILIDNVYNHTNLIYCVKNLIAIQDSFDNALLLASERMQDGVG